jgi:hypothetical protein
MIVRLAIAVMLPIAVAAFSVSPTAARSGGDLVRVMRDVDVYAQPGGMGKPIGMLRKNSEVELVNQRQDHWCNVQGVDVPGPGNFGWVWCGKGKDKKDYSLKPVVADMPEPTVTEPVEPTEPMESPADPDEPPAAPVKSDCKEIGPNEEAAGGSSDPKKKFECNDLGNGNRECCWVTYP